MNVFFKIILMMCVFTFTAGMSSFKSESNENTQTMSAKKSHQHTGITIKPHAPIDLKFETQILQAGVESTIPVNIISVKKADQLGIVYFAKDQGIYLHNARIQVDFGKQTKNQSNAHTLTVLPDIDGEYLIYLTATVIDNGKAQSRSFVIPVQVGNTPKQKELKPAGKITTDSTGTRIISMPAVETTD